MYLFSLIYLRETKDIKQKISIEEIETKRTELEHQDNFLNSTIRTETDLISLLESCESIPNRKVKAKN